MENLSVTTYRGYSKVNGSMPIEQLFNFIRGSIFRDKIVSLRDEDEKGNHEKADRIKKQLLYYTFTANYNEVRLPYSLMKYLDIITLDFDEMEFSRMPFYRQLVNDDPATLGSFLSPRAHGLKLFVYLKNEEAERLRAELHALGTVDYAALEKYHHRMYNLVRQYYETLLGTKADESGSDLSRGFYASYDPEAFLSAERLSNVKPLGMQIVLPEKGEPKARKKANGLPGNARENQKVDTSAISLQVSLEYRKALEYTSRRYRFEPSQRDQFLYCLGNQCYRHHILESEALQLVLHDFGNEPGFDVEQPVRNAYLYTTKTDQAEEEERKPLMRRVVDFLDQRYEFRRNVVLDRVEFRPKGMTSQPFASLRAKDLNTIYMGAHMAGLYCSAAMIKSVVDSDYAASFHPFMNYLESLKPWDGVTDYIGELAATVVAEDQAFFEDSLRRWLVALVAGAIDDNVQNQQMFMLYSKQGKGKSFFVRNLLPPELREYYRNGMINTDIKDHVLLLTSCFLINLDEYESMGSNRLSELKRIVTQDVVTERKVWDIQTCSFIRRASFAATTNNPRCLQDIGENRRVLFNCVQSINYRAKLNYEGIYAQAYALYLQHFHYWYEGKEVDELNLRNERFRLKDPVEENLFFYYRAAKPQEGKMKWLPAARMLSMLSMNGRLQSNRQTLQTLVSVLDMSGFRSRVTKDGVTEYAVVEYTLEEREKNALLSQMPKEGEIDWGDNK